MVTAAPRLDERLVELLERLARSECTPAEITRALAERARELSIAPPSYEHVRRLVQSARLERAIELERSSEVLRVLGRVAVGVDHASELVRVAHGEKPRRTK